MEKQAQKPQLSVYDNEPEPTATPSEAMSRLVGSGKRRGKKAPHAAVAAHSEAAEEEGRAFARHLKKMKGKDFYDAFHKGLMSGGAMEMEDTTDEEVEMEGGAMPAMPIVPPGGVKAKATGNPPQAPRGFERNSVELDRAARYDDEAPPTEGAGKPKKAKSAARSARGQMIARLMREEGLTLPQASKRLKEMK
jgi:hypothetical protein